MQHIEFKTIIKKETQGAICNTLATLTGLSKSRVKRAMGCGAVWRQQPGGKMRRVRRATTAIHAGDQIAIYYDEEILKAEPPVAQCLRDYRHYSIWYKPAGLMTQGSRFGDHCSLSRQVEKYFEPPRPALLVHRIDRETAGLVMMAHERKAAALFAELLRTHRIEKQYQVVVVGKPTMDGSEAIIDLPLDGRPAQTKFFPLHYDAAANQSVLRVQIITGRQHQIRRHFDLIGHPVMGDPRYGRGNKNKRGLRLVAFGLKFKCPFGNGHIQMEIDPDKTGL